MQVLNVSDSEFVFVARLSYISGTLLMSLMALRPVPVD